MIAKINREAADSLSELIRQFCDRLPTPHRHGAVAVADCLELAWSRRRRDAESAEIVIVVNDS